MRRRARPRAPASMRGALDEMQQRAAEADADPKMRTAGRWLRATAVTVPITCAVLLAASGSLLVYMSVSASGSHAARRVAQVTPTATTAATTAATVAPRPTATPAPTRGPALYRSIARNYSTGCAGGAPVPWPTVITSGVYGATPNEVALTFDDGPTPDSTPAILAVLEQTHTPATFMVEGQYASAWPDLLRREWNDGFAIGIHTWDHPDMPTISPSEQQYQLASTSAAIHAALGTNVCVWFWRPPYGDYNAQVLQTAASLSLTTVTWNDDPQDWALPGVSTIVSRVLGQVRPGSIVLMHDGPAQREETAEALPAILKGLRALGLRPVTLPQLLSDGRYPGAHPLAALLALSQSRSARELPASTFGARHA